MSIWYLHLTIFVIETKSCILSHDNQNVIIDLVAITMMFKQIIKLVDNFINKCGHMGDRLDSHKKNIK